MSSKVHSPAANLLRNSRLFSLPPPLPKPAERLSVNVSRASESATLPYPIAAAITTPTSSLVRGDWGLKRPLPLKSTAATSTPVIRIGPVDNIVHITDFTSAADTALTLKKWQELAQPMSEEAEKYQAGAIAQRQPKPFRWDLDHTTPRRRDPSGLVRRWKFGGPWIAGQTEAEFDRYVAKEIRRRRDEFREYLRAHARMRKDQDESRRAREQGRHDTHAPAPGATEVTDEELARHVRWLRGQQQLLFKLVTEFLDVPHFDPTNSWDERGTVDYEAIYTKIGPPKMHPSGGLSYLRAASVMPNDPGRGPQREGPAVEARVIQAQHRTNFARGDALVGIGGVITDDVAEEPLKSQNQRAQDPLHVLDPDTVGGGKVWVRPTRVGIDAKGRLRVSASECASPSSPARPPMTPGTVRPQPPPRQFGGRHSYGLESGSASGSESGLRRPQAYDYGGGSTTNNVASLFPR